MTDSQTKYVRGLSFDRDDSLISIPTKEQLLGYFYANKEFSMEFHLISGYDEVEIENGPHNQVVYQLTPRFGIERESRVESIEYSAFSDGNGRRVKAVFNIYAKHRDGYGVYARAWNNCYQVTFVDDKPPTITWSDTIEGMVKR